MKRQNAKKYIYGYTTLRRRQWHPTPVLLPGKSHGQRSLAGYSPGGHKEPDTTERVRANTHTHTYTPRCLIHCLNLGTLFFFNDFFCILDLRSRGLSTVSCLFRAIAVRGPHQTTLLFRLSFALCPCPLASSPAPLINFSLIYLLSVIDCLWIHVKYAGLFCICVLNLHKWSFFFPLFLFTQNYFFFILPILFYF